MKEIETEIKQAFKKTGEETVRYWNKLVKEKTRTGREDYKEGMMYKTTEKEFKAIIRGKFPIMLEKGFRAYSLKPVFLKGPKVKLSPTKRHLYRRIPIEDEVKTITWRGRGWRHPGFRGYRFLPQLEKYFFNKFQEKVSKIIDKYNKIKLE